MKPVTVAIVGLGYWGPNLLRNFAKTQGVTVKYACDQSKTNLEKFRAQYPAVQFIDSVAAVLDDKEVDGVIIATPSSTHFPLAQEALKKGKHVLIEKPMTATSSEAQALIDLAKANKLTLMVDHTFVYESAVQTIKKLVDTKVIGKLLYFDSARINLGLIRPDTNVLWDLAVHDLSILQTIAPLSGVTSVLAHGHKYHTDHEEIAHLHLEYKDGFTAHIHVSWLSPVKIRQTLIGGTEKMIAYNDNEPSEKIRLYDKGVEVKREENTFALPVYRSGDVLIPRLDAKEPLAELARHFAACIEGKEKPRTGGEDGKAVISILELADQSLAEKRIITLSL